jgi:REP element-mobilizing transposase RayT
VPRKLRIEVEDALYHVATRGVDIAPVFTSTSDRQLFLYIFDSVVSTYRWECHAYTLMGTHYHLLVRTRDANLAAGMQMLNGRYAQTFNRHRGRRGHLFGERYFSALIEDNAYLHAVHRYIALNPVRAGLAESPAEWPWGSYCALAGTGPRPRFLNVRRALALLGGQEDTAHLSFARLVSAVPVADLPYGAALSQYVGVRPGF